MKYPLLNVLDDLRGLLVGDLVLILITVFIDIFRSADLSGSGKALWLLFVLLVPLIGVLVYLIVRGGSMHRSGRAAGAAAGSGSAPVHPAGSGGGTGKHGRPADEAG